MGKDLSILRDVLENKKKENTETKTERPGSKKLKTSGTRKLITSTEKKAAAEGCYEGETRYTTILAEETLEKLRRLSYWDRRSIKSIISIALEKHINEYQKNNGNLKPIPEK